MDLTPRQFTDMAKPSIIPFIGDTRPSKGWDFAEYSNSNSFGSKLNQSLSTVEQNNASLSSQKKAVSSVVSTLQMATIKKGLDNFSLGQLSNIEFTGSKTNYENVNSSTKQYIDYRTYLYTPIDQLSATALKPTIDDDDDDDLLAELEGEDTPAKGHTIAHNLNLYSGFSGFNPFKEGDKANYDAFNSDKTMQMLTSNFMSPLRSLGQPMWDSINYYMNQIQSSSASIQDAPDVYNDNNIESFDIFSNYESVLRDFSENETKRNQWNENWFFSFILRRWSDAKNLYKNATLFSGKVASHVDDIQAPIKKQTTSREAFESYITSMDTLLGDLELLTGNGLTDTVAASTEEIAAIKTNLETLASQLDKTTLSSDQTVAIDELENRYGALNLPVADTTQDMSDLSMLEEWWTNVGAEVPDYGMLLPVGVFVESAVDMAAALELGNWENSLDSSVSDYISDQPGGFMDKAFNGYISHIMKNFLPDNSVSGVVTAEDLAIDNISYGESVFSELRAKGIIDDEGNISSRFNPDDMTVQFGITNDYYENDRIRAVLRKAMVGPVEFESLDKLSSSNKEREQIRIIEPDGESLTLSDVQALIGKGDTLQEQYENTRRAYNIFFDMYESMTATSVNSAPSKGLPNIREVGPDQYELDVYSHATWKEFSDKTAVVLDANGKEQIVGEWKDSGDQPLTLQFKSQSEAESFFTEIQQMMALLEPVLGTFEPTQDVGPGRYGVSYQDGVAVKTQLRVLNDNEGMLGENGVVSLGDSDHAVHIDYVHHTSYFKTQHWTDVSTELRDRIIQKIGKGIFTDSQINRMHKSKNKRQKEEYKERKAEHDEQEEERIKSELRSHSKRTAEQKKALKEHEMEVEKRTKALLAESKKADQERQKRLEEAKAASRKRDASANNKKK